MKYSLNVLQLVLYARVLWLALLWLWSIGLFWFLFLVFNPRSTTTLKYYRLPKLLYWLY